MASRLRQVYPLATGEAPFTKRALVIGGGVAGIQAALDIADGGCEVVVVEKSPSIGGHMIQYAEVFPTLDCPQCIMTPKMVEIAQHPGVRLLVCYERDAVELLQNSLGAHRGRSGPSGASITPSGSAPSPLPGSSTSCTRHSLARAGSATKASGKARSGSLELLPRMKLWARGIGCVRCTLRGQNLCQEVDCE